MNTSSAIARWGIRIGNDPNRHLYQRQLIHRRAGAAYKYGLGWVLLAMIQLPAVWLSLGVLGKKFAILARRYNAVTLNDMLYARYQSRLLVWLASLSLLVAFVGAMTVQFIGGALAGDRRWHPL